MTRRPEKLESREAQQVGKDSNPAQPEWGRPTSRRGRRRWA